jgi:diguanylate cyclase (GGDEF)-like protein
MKIEISTQGDILRHTAQRVVFAILSTVILTLVMLGVTFGTDPDTYIRLGLVASHVLLIGIVIAALLAGTMTYRSAILMRELNLARRELVRISHTDQLTGLLNRRGYNEAAGGALSQAGKAHMPAVALMCDIDRFKAINDKFGHEFGDQVLVEIGYAIRTFCDKNGIVVARHGGEEFAALMTGVTIEQAVFFANTLRRICATTEVLREGDTSTFVTVSIGLASSDEPATLPDLMRAADRALYLAKHGGRDRVVRSEISGNSVAA